MFISLNLDVFKAQDLNYGREFIILALYDNDNPLNSVEVKLDSF